MQKMKSCVTNHLFFFSETLYIKKKTILYVLLLGIFAVLRMERKKKENNYIFILECHFIALVSRRLKAHIALWYSKRCYKWSLWWMRSVLVFYAVIITRDTCVTHLSMTFPIALSNLFGRTTYFAKLRYTWIQWFFELTQMIFQWNIDKWFCR